MPRLLASGVRMKAGGAPGHDAFAWWEHNRGSATVPVAEDGVPPSSSGSNKGKAD